MSIGPDLSNCSIPSMNLRELQRDYPFHVLAAVVFLGVLAVGLVRALL
jgi:hypothetical protein